MSNREIIFRYNALTHYLYKLELLISKRQYFAHDFTNVLIDCIHFYGVKYLIHVDSCNTSVDYIVTADPPGDVSFPLSRHIPGTQQ